MARKDIQHHQPFYSVDRQIIIIKILRRQRESKIQNEFDEGKIRLSGTPSEINPNRKGESHDHCSQIIGSEKIFN